MLEREGPAAGRADRAGIEYDRDRVRDTTTVLDAATLVARDDRRRLQRLRPLALVAWRSQKGPALRGLAADEALIVLTR